MKEKRTQVQDIKNYLIEHEEGITSLIAIKQFGATRLADIIYRLKREPYNLSIKKRMRNVKNRYGGVSRVAVYQLDED